ncbi:MAG: hypothetical protein H6739_33680 [Alphaproteobacteria bacterium]|nr:hypothetical protein [Polyangiaceae bacterium]MCB9764776.1 hypothetical protein [Alphaproteobacteria bacterium]
MNPTLLLHALVRLRSPSRVEKLYRIRRPWPFVETATVDLGRHLALALGLLPPPTARVGALAFLLARVLDAFEDLSVDHAGAIEHMEDALAFLRGESAEWLSPGDLTAYKESDRVERALVARLPLLRTALMTLPDAARDDILTTLERVAGGMGYALRERAEGRLPDLRSYADRVLGPAIAFTFRTLELDPPAEVRIHAVARLLQAANNLRDMAEDDVRSHRWYPGSVAAQRLRTELMAGACAPLAVGLLQPLGFPRWSGARGALALMATTSARALGRVAVGPPLRLLGHPLRLALGCMISPAVWGRLLTSLDEVVHQTLCRSFGLEGAHRSSIGRPQTTCEPTSPIHSILCLFEAEALSLPEGPLSQQPADCDAAQRLLLGDFLLAGTLDHVGTLDTERCVVLAEDVATSIAHAAAQGST